MLIIGYFLGSLFSDFVEKVDHYIACVLLSKEAVFGKTENKDKLDFKSMLLIGFATSIDALTIGITFAFFEVNILVASLVIGFITLVMAILGVIIGNKFGNKLENKAQVIGGVILILIGIKILLEHLGILVL